MQLRWGVASNVGLVRGTNEDSYLVRRGLYAVCDGMGGARAGEVASEMACQALMELEPSTTNGEELLQAVKEANRAIALRSYEEDQLLGMGTTLTAALIGTESVVLVHVGDSRAYLFHEGHLSQLTDDHSWVGEMIRRGELTPTEAAVHPHRSVITKALGTDLEVEPDLIKVPFNPGDRLLLCSDGLTGMVTDEEIAAVLSREEDPQVLASLLVEAALASGGEDNVTVIVVEARPEGDESTEASELGEDKPVLGPSDRGAPPGSRLRTLPLRRRRGTPLPFRGRPRKQSSLSGNGGLLEDSVFLATELGRGVATAGRRRPRWVLPVVIVIIVVIVVIGAFAVVNSTVYYVGSYEESVALFRGLPVSFLGLSLSRVVELAPVRYDSLAPYVRARVDAHDLVTKEEGQNFLRSLSTVP